MFDSKIFLASRTMQLHQEIQKLSERMSSGFSRIIFMSMHNDIDWTTKNNASICDKNSSEVSFYAAKFPMGLWSFRGPRDEVPRLQTRRRLESNCRRNDVAFRRELAFRARTDKVIASA